MMRALALLALFALVLGGCVQTNLGPDTPRDVQNQPHLPPPGFPSGPVSSAGDRICSGMVARGQLATCSADEFCFIPTGQFCGAADYPGVCRIKPEACTMEYDPVCGCDGKTYGNECAAHAGGTSVANQGACDA